MLDLAAGFNVDAFDAPAQARPDARGEKTKFICLLECLIKKSPAVMMTRGGFGLVTGAHASELW
jgi:hypothetical protein